jgi:hypothetical protein
MNDSMMPDWMKKKQEKNELEEAKAEVRQQHAMAAANLLEIKRPSFWLQLREQLAIAVHSLRKFNMAGQISEHSGDSMRIAVSRPGILVNQTYTDLFFKPSGITATGLNLGAYTLTFCVLSETEIGVSADGSVDAMGSPEAARYIMERMINLIDLRSH